MDETEKERLAICVSKMKHASSVFYGHACASGNHSFIEFAGLMNEYIQVCERAAEADIDFTMASTHTGVALPMAPFNFSYLAEKLNCIYGPSLTADKKQLEFFVARMSK